MSPNWWSITGLVCDIIGVFGAGMDSFLWAKSASIDVIPHVPALTRLGFGVPRLLYRRRYCIYWTLILLGFIFQLVGQLPESLPTPAGSNVFGRLTGLVDGNDFVVLGLFLELGGGYLLARGFLRAVSYETAHTFSGYNPHQIKALIQTHYDAVFGFMLLFWGLLASLCGTIRAAHAKQSGSLAYSLWIVPIAATAALLSLGVCVRASERLARRRYIDVLGPQQREIFELARHAVRHGGRRAEEVTLGNTLSPETTNERMKEARERLERLAALLDGPAAEGESLESLIERLTPYFQSAEARFVKR